MGLPASLPYAFGGAGDIVPAYEFVTPREVASSMSATIRSATPTTPDARSEVMRLDGSTVRALLHVNHDIPIGIGAQVLRADLVMYKADAWASGTHLVTASPADEEWNADSVTWDTQPDVRDGYTAAVAGSGAAGDEVVVDVTNPLKDALTLAETSGTPWHGFRLSVDTTGEKKLYSAFAPPNLRPFLRIETSLPPLAPYDLQPNAGRAVSETKPELIARYADPDPSDTVSAIQVRVSTDDTFATTHYDSGKTALTLTRFDTDDLPAGAPSFTALTSGTIYYWQMKPWDNHGLEGAWSEVASFTVVAKGALTLTSPGSGSVDSPVPTISWTFADQEQAEVDLEKKVGGIWTDHWLIPRHVTAETSFTVPDAYALQEGVLYRVVVRGWDDVAREDMPGDRAFSEDSQEFVLIGISV